MRAKLIEEIGDLKAAIEFFTEQNLTEDERIEILHRKNRKVRRFKKWNRRESE